MSETTLSQIDDVISRLAITEQLWLIERVAHRLSASSWQQQNVLDSQLIAMAADPAIQRELQQIDVEFAVVMPDGLDTD